MGGSAPLGVASARARGSGKRRADRRAVYRALVRNRRRGKITRGEYRRWRRWYVRSIRTYKRLRGARRTQLGYVIDALEELAMSRRLGATRMPSAFVQLERNRRYWRAMPYPASGDQVSFARSEILYQYYPGEGLQLQPLSTFKKANLMYGVCQRGEPTCDRDGLRRLLDGRAQFAVLDIHDLARARERGRDVVGVMALVQRPLEAVLAQPGVRRPRDLAGRRVGVSGRRADTAILDAIVRHDGGDPARMRRVVIAGGGAAAALRAGRLAAAIGSWSEAGVSRAGIHAFRADDYGAPGYPELVLCVTRATLTDERGVVRATVAALRRGYDEALADPESAVEALVDRAPGLDRTATEAAFDAVSPAFLEGATRFGDLDRASLEAWARWEARERIVRRPPDVDRAFAFGF
jgi:ABC-type nitrate/sulfonate/bicarbonate transport system substrate-binding protein